MTHATAFRVCFAWSLALSFLGAPPIARATANRGNLAGILYVADLTGESQIDTGAGFAPLTKKSVHAANGASIESKARARGSLVFSNGTALYVGPATHFEISEFRQEPFLPNRTDLDAEPSISRTVVKISRGSLGMCTSKLLAGSSMTYLTPHATIDVRGRKVMIEVSDTETRVLLIEGNVTVATDVPGAGQTLRPGQQAIVRKTAHDQAAVLSIQPIMDEQQAALDETVSLACVSRRTVFFEVSLPCAGEEAKIRPIEIAPAIPDPSFTVSPARIGG